MFVFVIYNIELINSIFFYVQFWNFVFIDLLRQNKKLLVSYVLISNSKIVFIVGTG